MSKYFSDLDDNLNDVDVVLLQTTCDKIDELLFAKVQNRLNISNDNIIYIRTKEDFDTVKSLQGILTPTEGRWLVYCDTTVFIETNNLIDLMLHSNTCIFFIKVNYYKTYKDMKTRLKTKNVFDYYVTYLNRPNLLYIYDSLVPKSNGLTTQVITYLSKNYSSDIEQIFQLFEALKAGKVIDKPNDVVKCVGIGGNNIESFIFSLLTPISGSAKGLKLVKKKRYSQAYSIYNALGPKRFYDFYKKTLQDFLDIQMLRLTDEVYDTLIGLDEPYKHLARYNRYLYKFKELDISSIMRLMSFLPVNFESQVSIYSYINDYYKDCALDLVKSGKLTAEA